VARRVIFRSAVGSEWIGGDPLLSRQSSAPKHRHNQEDNLGLGGEYQISPAIEGRGSRTLSSARGCLARQRYKGDLGPQTRAEPPTYLIT